MISTSPALPAIRDHVSNGVSDRVLNAEPYWVNSRGVEDVLRP